MDFSSIKQFVKLEHKDLDARQLLQSSPVVLIGVDEEILSTLAELSIHSVFDLAASKVFNTAYEISKASEGNSSTFSSHGFLPSDAVQNDVRERPVEQLLGAELSILDGVGESLGANLRSATGLQTVRDLSYWSPFQAARQILSVAFGGEEDFYDPDAPVELLPKAGESATEKAYYTSIFIDKIERNEELDEYQSLEYAGALSLSDLNCSDSCFKEPALGAVLTFEQAWYFEKLALGQLLHSLALAPAESTKIAVVDWSRRTSASVDESVSQAEQLNNEITQRRSISETTRAVAKESQTGFSNTIANGESSQFGGAGGGSFLGMNWAASGGGSKNNSFAHSVSSSQGSRDIATQALQNIAECINM